MKTSDTQLSKAATNSMNTGHPATPRPQLASLLGFLALLLLAFHFRAVPHILDPVRETNTVTQFDTSRALARLSRVLDGTPHPVDSNALDATRMRLLQEIRAMGYSPEIREHDVCVTQDQGNIRCTHAQNLFFRAGPLEGPALVLSAHYDSWDASPGFGDDGIGLAVWLEVAYLLQQQVPARPLVFLFTDGEELGMLGAQAFVDNRADYEFDVGRVINLEARGTRGPAMMFETSHPNAGIVRDWAGNGARRFSNSMMTAVYELLPNGTDLTAHLNAGSAGINIAIADGSDFYHTSRDDLATLDPASVQHMGDQALGAVQTFITADWRSDVDGGEVGYSDIISRLFIALPQTLTSVLLLLCFGANLVLLVRPTRAGSWQKPEWRTLLLPPILFITAGSLATLLPMAIRLFRPDPVFWMAHPQALNMTMFATTLLLALLLLLLIVPRSRAETLFASGCFWLIGPGVLLSIAVPGFAMFYLIPGVYLLVTGSIAWLFPRYRTLAYLIGSVLLMLNFFPMLQLIQVAMGLATPAMFAIMEAMVLCPMLALLYQAYQHRNTLLLTTAGVVVTGFVLTVMAPAYDIDHPLPLNFSAHYDADQRKAVLSSSARSPSLPPDLREQFVTEQLELPRGVATDLPARELDYVERPIATANLLSEEITADGRRIRVQLSAPGARVTRLIIPRDARPLRLLYAGKSSGLQQGAERDIIVEIFGRSADGAIVEIAFGTREKVDLITQGIWSGLPEAAQAIADQRPTSSVRIQIGDISTTTRTLNL